MFFHHRLPGRLLSPSGAASDVPSGLGFEASGLGWLGFLIIMLVWWAPKSYSNYYGPHIVRVSKPNSGPEVLVLYMCLRGPQPGAFNQWFRVWVPQGVGWRIRAILITVCALHFFNLLLRIHFDLRGHYCDRPFSFLSTCTSPSQLLHSRLVVLVLSFLPPSETLSVSGFWAEDLLEKHFNPTGGCCRDWG